LADTQLATKLRTSQAQVMDLEKELEVSAGALKITQLDYDVTLSELQEIKKSESVKKAKKS
jgi:hypothetical protein